MGLLKGLGVWIAWVAAHATAGLLFYVSAMAVPPFASSWSLLANGLAAGVVFGLGQALVLRWFLPQVRWWLPATVAASPVSWYWGMLIAVGTISLGGWLGGWISAGVQAALLLRPLEHRKHIGWLAAGWLVAAMIGSFVFYYGYLMAIEGGRYNPPPLASMLVGSAGYGASTGIVLALIVTFASARGAQPSEIGAVVSRT